jgi:F-type H+-transporting ATPase subunit b
MTSGGGEPILSIVFKFVNFGILVAILVKFGGKPLKNFLINRHNTIKEKIEEASKLLAEAEILKQEYEGKLARLDGDIEVFKKTIIGDMEKEKTKIIEEAAQVAAKIKEQALLTYEQELREVKDKIKADIAELTIKKAEQLIVEKISKSDHEKMVDDFIVKLRSLN